MSGTPRQPSSFSAIICSSRRTHQINAIPNKRKAVLSAEEFTLSPNMF
jgi:hypothetical protein